MSIDEKIERLDLRLFENPLSANPEGDLRQNTDDDRRTLLAVQTAVRRCFPGYVYLEIGSYKGSSLQSYVVDPLCQKIISIDPRPGATPDSREIQYYDECSAESMLGWLKKIPGSDVSKIKTIESTASKLCREDIADRPHLCFIDGEHTDEAALIDARFCRSIVAENGLLVFHDANLVFGGLQTFLNELTAAEVSFHAHVLPRSIFMIEFGNTRLCADDPVKARIEVNYKAYLGGMSDNDWYRQAYHRPVYRALRRIRRLFPKRAE